MKLQDKTALVTGAGRGIGRAVAVRLAGDGASVGVHFKSNAEAAQNVAAEIQTSGGRAFAVQADLSNLEAIQTLGAAVSKKLGALDILVNNAGWATFHPLAEVTPEEFAALFDLNVRGLFFTTQELLPLLRDGGRIVNISSGITRVNAAGGSVYAASKAAVEAFTRCWAAELGPRGITVNCVSPGMTQTDLLAEVTSPEVLEKMKTETPLGRLGQPEDIADVVAFLCSEKARWLTAQNLLANGGV